MLWQKFLIPIPDRKISKMIERTNRPVGGASDRRAHGPIDGWMDGQMDAWTDEWIDV